MSQFWIGLIGRDGTEIRGERYARQRVQFRVSSKEGKIVLLNIRPVHFALIPRECAPLAASAVFDAPSGGSALGLLTFDMDPVYPFYESDVDVAPGGYTIWLEPNIEPGARQAGRDDGI